MLNKVRPKSLCASRFIDFWTKLTKLPNTKARAVGPGFCVFSAIVSEGVSIWGGKHDLSGDLGSIRSRMSRAGNLARFAERLCD